MRRGKNGKKTSAHTLHWRDDGSRGASTGCPLFTRLCTGSVQGDGAKAADSLAGDTDSSSNVTVSLEEALEKFMLPVPTWPHTVVRALSAGLSSLFSPKAPNKSLRNVDSTWSTPLVQRDQTGRRHTEGALTEVTHHLFLRPPSCSGFAAGSQHLCCRSFLFFSLSFHSCSSSAFMLSAFILSFHHHFPRMSHQNTFAPPKKWREWSHAGRHSLASCVPSNLFLAFLWHRGRAHPPLC